MHLGGTKAFSGVFTTIGIHDSDRDRDGHTRLFPIRAGRPLRSWEELDSAIRDKSMLVATCDEIETD